MAWWMTKARRLLKSGGARPDQSERRGGMTAEERFLFDLEGYLVIKQVLSASEVAALNAVAERKILAPSERPAYGRRLDHDFCIFTSKGGGDRSCTEPRPTRTAITGTSIATASCGTA